MSNFGFAKEAVKKPRMTGALVPTFRYAAQAIAMRIRPEQKIVVEYGSGNGAITKEILNHLPPDGRLITVELNKNFIPELEKIKDDRLTIVNEDVSVFSERLTQLRFLAELKLPRIDIVVSGIPFTPMTAEKRRIIFYNTHAALIVGGTFLVYQYSRFLMPLLKKTFKRENVKFDVEPRNFPFYFIMTAQKVSSEDISG